MSRRTLAAPIALALFATALAGPAGAGEDDSKSLVETLRPLGPPLSARCYWSPELGFSFDFDAAALAPPAPVDPEALSVQKLDGLTDGERWLSVARERMRRKEASAARESAVRALTAFYAESKVRPSDSLLVQIVSAADLVRSASPTERDAAAADKVASAAAGDAAAGPRIWSWCGARSAVRAIEITTGKPPDETWTLDDCLAALARAPEIPAAALAALDEAERFARRAVEATAGSGADAAVRAETLSRRFFVRMLVSAFRARQGDEQASAEALRGTADDVVALAAAAPDVPEAVVAGAMFAAMADRGRPLTAAEPNPADRARAKAAIERLAEIAKSKDRSLASRAWHGTALLQYGVLRDREAARASAPRAVESDPSAERSWILGAGLLREAERWAELCAWCEKWSAARDGATRRGTWAHAEWMRGDRAAAERRWREALSTSPKDLHAAVGVAACLLAKGGAAALDEADALLRAAEEAHRDRIVKDREIWTWFNEHSAACAYLRGSGQTALSIANAILEKSPDSRTAHAVQKLLVR